MICSARTRLYDLPPIPTGCEAFDRALCGGLRRGRITELYGEAGCGKTQIALQIAANASSTGAVYIFTEGAFPSKRLFSLIRTIHSGDDSYEHGNKIRVRQVIEVEELIHCVERELYRLLEITSGISIVILDSIAAPFRGCDAEVNRIIKAEQLKRIGMGLLKCAKRFNLAVLCINQVSANLNDCTEAMKPYLGLTWSKMITTRICVDKKDLVSDQSQHVKNFRIVYSPELKNVDVDYLITQEGVISTQSAAPGSTRA